MNCIFSYFYFLLLLDLEKKKRNGYWNGSDGLAVFDSASLGLGIQLRFLGNDMPARTVLSSALFQ